MTVQWDWLMVLGPCWVGALARMRDLRGKPGNQAARWICVALTTLAASMTLQLAVVPPAVDALTAPGTAGLTSNCLTVLALAAGRCTFLSLTHDSRAAAPRVRRWAALGLAVCAVMILLFLTTPSNHPEFLARLYSAAPVPIVSWQGYVYVAYVVPAAAALGWASARYARLTDRFTLRLGLRLLGAGSTIAAGYAVIRLAGMVAYDAGVERSVLYGPLVGLLFRIAITGVLLGLAVPLLSRRLGVDRIVRWIALDRQYRLLFPLWTALRTEFPAISLHPPPRHLPFTSPDSVLYRRMIEIWDGLLCLRPYVEGAVDAAAVQRALASRRNGERAADTGVSITTTGDEVAELTELAKHYRDLTRR